MVRILQCSVVLILAVMAVNATITTKRATRASTPDSSYRKYYMNNVHDCGTTNYLSTSDKVLVNAWQDSYNPIYSCKITFILNSGEYHLEAGYSRFTTNYFSSSGVKLSVYGGYNENFIIYRDSTTLNTNSGGQYQRIQVVLENYHLATAYDFSILITAQRDNSSASVWWLGVLIPVIFIAIVASSVGYCVRRRRILRYQRMNDPVAIGTVTGTIGTAYPTGTATYPAGRAAYPTGTATYPTGQAAYPTGQAAYPTGTAAYPTGTATYPTGTTSYPTGTATYPTGTASYPTGPAAYPTGAPAANPTGTANYPNPASYPPVNQSPPTF